MNSNSSPHSRPARRPQRRPRTAGSAHDAELQSSARRSRGVTRRDATRSQRRKKTSASSTALPAAAQLTMGQRIRKVGLTLAIPHAVIIMSIIVVAVATLLMTSSSIAVLPTVIATAWLVFHAAPVAGEDVVIAAVPLLPALLTIALSARQVHASVRKRFSIIDLLMVFAWSLSTPLLLTVIALLMLADAQAVYPVAVPPIGPVLVSVLLVHLMAFVVGLGPKAWRALARRYRVPLSIIDGVGVGVKTLAALSAAAAVVGVILLVIGWERQAEIMAAYPQAGTAAKLALVLLSLAYIPNAVIGVGGVLLGSEYQFGAASVSLFETHLVPLPPFPVLGVVPASSASWAWIGLFIPVAVIVAVMLRMRPSPVMTLSAGLATWVIVAIAVLLTGGEVGAYSDTGLPVLWTASLALIWVGGIALAVTLMLLVFQRRQARGESEEDPADYAEQELDMLADDAVPAEHAQGEGAEKTPDAEYDYAEDAEDSEYSEYTADFAANDSENDGDSMDKTDAADNTNVTEDSGEADDVDDADDADELGETAAASEDAKNENNRQNDEAKRTE